MTHNVEDRPMTTTTHDNRSPVQTRPAPEENEPTGLVARMTALARRIAESEEFDPDALTVAALTLVCEAVPGARWASLTHVGREPRTIAASRPEATVVDEWQYRTRNGPCLTALDTTSVIVSDFADETRWPAFTEGALAHTVARGALSYPLEPAGRPASSLNLYTDTPAAFDGLALYTAALAATSLVVALTAIAQRKRAEHLEIALDSSRIISAAIGILMHRHRWTYEQAFAALRTASQHTQRKLRDLADEVMLIGSLPG
jgi:hypothetical protein